MTRRNLLLIVLALGVVLGAFAVVSLFGPQRSALVTKSIVSGQASIGGPFTLTNHLGKQVTDADFSGRYMLVYFGYSFCPDVCPTELQTMGRALDRLGKGADKITPVFISIDPARDGPSELAAYVKAFHPRMVGLTGTAAGIAAAAKAYKVYYRKAPGSERGPMDYLMDHSSFIYLMGPDGKFRAFFRSRLTPDALAKDLRRHTG
jgi:protein SCO1/2